MKKIISLAVCLLFLITAPVFADDNPDEQLQELMQLFKKTRQINLHFAKQEYDEAISICNDILTESKDVKGKDMVYLYVIAETYLNRGKAYESKNLLDEAIADYNKAIESSSEEFITYKTYEARAGLYVKKGLVKEAVADYNQAIAAIPFLHDRVIITCRSILALDPENAQAYYTRGYAHFDKALFYKNMAKSINPEDDQAYYRKCVDASEEFFAKAITDYDKAIDLNPDYYAAYNSRGIAYLEAGFMNNAIADYTKAIEISPSNFGAYYNRANAYFEKKLYDEAIADYSKIISLNPESFEYFTNTPREIVSIEPAFYAYHGRAQAYAQKELFDKALADYNQAIKINPLGIDAYYSRGNIYLEQKRYDKAADDYSAANKYARYDYFLISSRPPISVPLSTPPFFFAHITTDNDIAHLSKAKMNKAFEIDELNNNFPSLRVQYYERFMRYGDAIAECDKILKGDTPEFYQNNPDKYSYVYRTRGRLYDRQGLFDEALADYSKAIEINPHDYQNYLNRGTIYTRKNLFDEAIADYKQSIKLNPLSRLSPAEFAMDNAIKHTAESQYFFYGHYMLSSIYYKKKLYDEAILTAGKMIEFDPDGSAYIDFYNDIKGTMFYSVRGLSYMKKGLYQEAYADFNKFIELSPRGVYAYYCRALALEKLNRTTEAAQDYLIFLKFAPPMHKSIPDAQKRIKTKGLLDNAIAVWGRAIESDPDNAENYFYRGSAYERKGFLNEAIDDYSRAVEIAPQNYLAYHSRGQAYFAKKLYDDAIADYDAAIKINLLPEEKTLTMKSYFDSVRAEYQDAVIANCRGLAYLEKGLYQEAFDNFTNVIYWGEFRNSPGVYTAYYNRALTCEKLNRYADAVKDYMMFLKQAPAGDEKIPYVKKRLSYFVESDEIEIEI